MRYSYKLEFETEDAELAGKMIARMQIAYAEAWRILKAHGRMQAIGERTEKDGVIQWEIE